MTGEITLRGRVLPIGGLKEKILAAHRGELKKVIIPMDNKKDLEDIPKRILRKIEIVPVEHMDSVLREALIIQEGDRVFAPDEEYEPFRLEACETPKQGEVQSELTAH